MALKAGTWKVNFSGFLFDLQISPVEQGGIVRAQARIAETPYALVGYFDESAGKLILADGQLTVANVNSQYVFPTLEGYLFSTPLRPDPGVDVLWMLVGTFICGPVQNPFSELPLSYKRNTFGWFAQISEVM